MESLEHVASLLSHRGHRSLANLLSSAVVEFVEIDQEYDYQTQTAVVLAEAVIHAPISDYDRLKALSKEDKQLILEAMQEIWPNGELEGDLAIVEVGYRLDRDSLRDDSYDGDEVLQLLQNLRHMLIEVSTGGPRIDDVNEEYKECYFQLNAELEVLGLRNPIPYTDLWEWYGKWKRDLPTYQSRREFIVELCEPIERRLRENPSSLGQEIFAEPAGWPLVDRTLSEIRNRLRTASTEEQFQTVGLLCREALTSLAETVFDRDKHPPLDEVEISKTDAKRMLERYLATEMGGGSNAIARKQAKASLDLANALQHKRTAGFRDAALCAEATTSVVNLIAILAGRRDGNPEQNAV